MSTKRTEKRHPKLSAESALTTRADVIAFAQYLSRDAVFCSEVMRTAKVVEHAQAIVTERNRRESWPKWRKWVHKTKLDLTQALKHRPGRK